MSDKTWKAVERRIANYFGTKRNPLSGGNAGHTRSDTLHDKLFIECKHTSKNSAIFSLFDDTAEKAKIENKTPLLALHKKGRKEFLIVISSEDFRNVPRP